MKQTTSVLNYYSLNGTQTGYGRNLVIRPPQHLKVFRATFYADNREDTQNPTAVNISNSEILDAETGIFLFSSVHTSTSVVVPPGTNTGTLVVNLYYVVFDRRGEGYMVDDFYLTGKGGISVIWEGILENNE